MTGKELIKWIQDNNAEELECVTQYRDGGGSYIGGEIINNPVMAVYKFYDNNPYDVDIAYKSGLTPNCIVL